ncbi:MAG: hypothetical protein AB1746_03980 [Candidatus Zixiibacteriota bacterium]
MKAQIIKLLIFLFLAGLVLIRFINLDADPPSYFTGHGQAQLTDPYHLTHFAENKVLYNEWDPFEFHRWDIFKNSLISFFSYLFFSQFGASRLMANLAAALLFTIGIFLFLAGLDRYRKPSEITATALFLFFNSTLMFYGRLPFLENGLIFLSGLTFYIFIKFHEKSWGLVLTGILISFAALAGKLFGFILFGPVILTIIYRYRLKSVPPILITIAGSIAGALLYIFIFYGIDISLLMQYYREQTIGMYGAPPGFVSIANFFKMLLTYGGESGLYEYTPFFILLTAISAIIMILTVPFAGKLEKQYIPLIFIFSWLIFGILALMPFQYRPIRYGLFLYIPMSAICGYAVRATMEKKSRLSLHNKYLSLPLIILILWTLIVQIWIFFSSFGKKFESGVAAMFPAFLIALVFTGVLFFLLVKMKRTFPRKEILIALGVICAGFIVRQGIYITQGLFKSHHYLVQYNKELVQILNPEAVLTGPYGATLTTDNRIKNIIYMFGLANIQKDLFEKYPISHIAADQSNWNQALEDFPFLGSAVRIVQMPIRDVIIDIYRVPNTSVAPTDFEQGTIFLSIGQADSAYVYLKRFNDRFPDHFWGRTHLAYAALINGRTDECLAIIDRLIVEHPNDYVLHGFCKTLFTQLYNATKDEKYRQLAQHHATLEQELK